MAPILMSDSEIGRYCAFLTRFAGKRRGSLAQRLREIAAALANPWSHQ